MAALPLIPPALEALYAAAVVTIGAIGSLFAAKKISDEIDDYRKRAEEQAKAKPTACEACAEPMKSEKTEESEKSDAEPKKGKKVKSSQSGDKVRTPDSHPEDFNKLPRGQGSENVHTGEIWKECPPGRAHRGEKWDVTSGGRRVGEVKPDGTIGRTW